MSFTSFYNHRLEQSENVSFERGGRNHHWSGLGGVGTESLGSWGGDGRRVTRTEGQDGTRPCVALVEVGLPFRRHKTVDGAEVGVPRVGPGRTGNNPRDLMVRSLT